MIIDLEKERNAFEESLAKKGIELRFIHIVFDDGVYRFSDKFNDQSDFHKDALHEIECGWEAWQQRADIAKSEISDLKQQIAELHASRESLLEYKNKLENPDYVLVPTIPTMPMLIKGRHSTERLLNIPQLENLYKAMIKASQ